MNREDYESLDITEPPTKKRKKMKMDPLSPSKSLSLTPIKKNDDVRDLRIEHRMNLLSEMREYINSKENEIERYQKALKSEMESHEVCKAEARKVLEHNEILRKQNEKLLQQNAALKFSV